MEDNKMDEVLDKLGSTVITQEVGTDESKTNFEGLYKNWGKLGSQEERRREILEVQKSNRNNKLDKFRGIFELVQAVEEHDIFRSERAYYRPTIYVAGFNRAPNYSNVLMMSEWIIEKPGDFAENWLAVPCPKGVRMLVVATNGTTKFYTKYGHFRFQCRTALPGGSRCDPKSRSNCVVLDGFYDKATNVFFVLDLLAWNNQPMTDGEAEFRHYWLETQLGEKPALKLVNKKNEVIFSILPKTPCDTESLTKFMMKFPHFEGNVPALDGILFYHKRAHYFAGQTPLVGWLFPFMVPEVLGEDIKIHKAYELLKPSDYTNQADYIIKFEEKYEKKSRRSSRGSRRNSEMDTTGPSTAEAKPKTDKKSKDKPNTKDDKMEVSKTDESKPKENEGMETETGEKKSEDKDSAIFRFSAKESEENTVAKETEAMDTVAKGTEAMDAAVAKDTETVDKK